VSDIILAYGGMAAMTKRATKTEEFLKNKEWTYDTISQATKILYNEFEPITDARASAEARRIMAKNLLIKFFNQTQQK
jgi:xanthine dehydrogenase small subunit